jgi:hypothetical protein
MTNNNYSTTITPILSFENADTQKLDILKELKGKPGSMLGKTHTAEARFKISIGICKPVTLYNNNNQYILTFKNSVQLSEFIGCHKITIGRYVKSGKCYNGLYYFQIKGFNVS